MVFGATAMAADLPKEGTFSGTVAAAGTYKATVVGKDRCVTNTSSEKGGVGLYERWGRAPRGRQSGAGLKPLQAAVVKSDGGERCSKRRDLIPLGMIRRGERKQTVDDVSKFHRRCQNRGCDLLPGSARRWP